MGLDPKDIMTYEEAVQTLDPLLADSSVLTFGQRDAIRRIEREVELARGDARLAMEVIRDSDPA